MAGVFLVKAKILFRPTVLRECFQASPPGAQAYDNHGDNKHGYDSAAYDKHACSSTADDSVAYDNHGDDTTAYDNHTDHNHGDGKHGDDIAGDDNHAYHIAAHYLACGIIALAQPVETAKENPAG